MSTAVSLVNSGIPQNVSSPGNLQQGSGNGSSGGDSLTATFQRSDSLEISSEAQASFAALLDQESNTTATIQNFSAEFSASFRSQTMGHVQQMSDGRGFSATSFSQTQFNFKVSVSASSMTVANEKIDIDKMMDGKMKDYLILMKSFLKEMRQQLHKYVKDIDDIVDIEDMDKFVSNLSGKLEHFLNKAASSEGGGGKIAAAMQSLDIRIEVSAENISFFQQSSDPLALDLDGDGVQMVTPWEGVDFDINADGIRERVAALVGQDAFLALDRNENGKIDNGGELFGDQHGARHGFAELARFDENKDGVIDARDAVYKNLLLYNQGRETRSLMEAKIQSISLQYLNVEQYSAGNRISQLANFTREDGSTGDVADIWLNYLSQPL